MFSIQLNQYYIVTPSVTAPGKKLSIVFSFQSSSLIQVFWVGGRGRGKGTVSINCLHLYVHVSRWSQSIEISLITINKSVLVDIISPFNSQMFLFINFFYCYRKSISIFDCYEIAILNILITDINYYFIDWLHLVLNFLYFNYFSQVCWYNWHQCHWGGRIKTNIWSFLSNETRKWEQPVCCWCQGCSCPSTWWHWR